MKAALLLLALFTVFQAAASEVICDIWINLTDSCEARGSEVIESLLAIEDFALCTKVYLKTNSTDTPPCRGGAQLKEQVFIKGCDSSESQCQTLASEAPLVEHVVLCETKDFKLASVAPWVFAEGTENVKKLALVNHGPQFDTLGMHSLSGISLEVLDLRSNAGLTASSIDATALESSQVEKVLLPRAPLCSSVTALGFAAEYGDYVGTDLSGAACPPQEPDSAAQAPAATTGNAKPAAGDEADESLAKAVADASALDVSALNLGAGAVLTP